MTQAQRRDTDTGFPALIERRRIGWSPRPRITANAAFVSQLIAEREHLATQRARRLAPLGTAISAYDLGGRSDQRRLPQGFFRFAEA